MAYLEYQPRSTLYHYTSPEGFLGILSSKQLWFSDLRSTNDPREMQFGFEKFLRAIDELRKKETDLLRNRFLGLMEERLTRYRQNTTAYCCCFSMAGDLLPMWREYGQNYGGIAIGFRPTSMLGIPGRVQKVSYLETADPGAFQLLIDGILSAVIGKRLGALEQVALGSEIAAAMISAKHVSWSYEQEVRIVHMQTAREHLGTWKMPTAELPDGKFVDWTEPLTRSNGSSDVKYKAFSFGRYRNGVYDPGRAIERIILGPHCKWSAKYVSDVMSDHGFSDFAVTSSECSIK